MVAPTEGVPFPLEHLRLDAASSAGLMREQYKVLHMPGHLLICFSPRDLCMRQSHRASMVVVQ